MTIDTAEHGVGSKPARRRAGPVRRLVAVLLWIVATLAGLVAGLWLFVLTAGVSAVPVVFAAAAVAGCFLAVAALGRLAGLVAGSGRRSLRTSAVITAVLAVVGGSVLFWPLTRDESHPEAAAGVRYWDLDTGSRLAYLSYPATTKRTTGTPIVFLHGGPGGPLRPFEYDFFPQFTRDGYDVYLFEQAGVGASRALPHAADYTAARAVADLEAVRRKTGAERMVLIGQSWGGSLAALYTAAYPQHVAKVVFSEPGTLPGPPDAAEAAATGTAAPGSAPGAAPSLLAPRFLMAAVLAQTAPAAAERFAPRAEVDHYLDQNIPGFIRQSFCARDGNRIPEVDLEGFDFYANTVTSSTIGDLPDPRPALRRSSTPALVLRGECSYIPWPDTYAYTRVLRGSSLVYIKDAGHVLWASRPTETAAAIRAFLLDRPQPVAPYRGDKDPAAR
ncbi:alpha/beta fold hydrolase [Actinoplanes sp. M2I2]|uniref:alpha/beta fold hydrolase n=1 Tax=Actinoplanes sp. M2I2 TaxID=1734444 RepID=UPI002022391A|nr:alpha/beta hydrolase [Actinoplanes sp. M2I2]